jgi:hypothetical protein
MTIWPDILVREIARRRCVIVVGSGVSAQAKGADGISPPTWKDFLKNCNNKLHDGPRGNITSAIDQGDLLHACEWLLKGHDAQWSEHLRAAFSAPRFLPSESHKIIARLDTRIVFSLNFEDILDRAFHDITGGTCITKRYYDDGVAEFLRGHGRYLVKVHGALDEVDKIIFTQKQYSEARIKYAAFYNTFNSALMSNTFLFLGAGTKDPDINLVLENYNFTYSKSYPHYFLSASDFHDDLKGSLRANRNLEVIEYDKIDENHSGLPEALNTLLNLVEEARGEISNKYSW